MLKRINKLSILVILVSTFILCTTAKLLAQTTTDTEVWPQYYIQLPVNKKLAITSDYSHRYNGFFGDKTQWIARAGLIYKLSRKLNLSGGYAYSEYFTALGVRTEHRPWQQIQMDNDVKGLKVMQRIRLEERFQEDKVVERFNYRFRYQIHLAYPLLSKQRLSLQIAEEPMVNAGKQVLGNKFDQNRFQGGLQIKVAENVFITPAYMYIYQYQPSKREFRNINVFRTGITYRKL